jgi:hypothetical protein
MPSRKKPIRRDDLGKVAQGINETNYKKIVEHWDEVNDRQLATTTNWVPPAVIRAAAARRVDRYRAN